jgi:hypothetical protein
MDARHYPGYTASQAVCRSRACLDDRLVPAQAARSKAILKSPAKLRAPGAMEIIRCCPPLRH